MEQQPRTNTEELARANRQAAAEVRVQTKWAAYNQGERAYNASFEVLEGQTITELAQSFESPGHRPIVIDLMAPTGFLEDVSSRLDINGLAVGLTDLRPSAVKRRDTLAHIAMQQANILEHHPTWDGHIPQGKRKFVEGIHDWVHAQGVECADIIVCRPGGPLYFLTPRPKVMFGLLDRAYRTVRPDGGIVLTSMPKPISPLSPIEGRPPRANIEGVSAEDIRRWADAVNESGIGVQIRYAHSPKIAPLDSLMITRSPGSPDRLPTMDDMRLLRVQRILERMRAATITERTLFSDDLERVETMLLRAAQGRPTAIARTDSAVDHEMLVALNAKVAHARSAMEPDPRRQVRTPRHRHFDVVGFSDGEESDLMAETPTEDEISINFLPDNRYRLAINFVASQGDRKAIAGWFDTSFLPCESMTREEYEVLDYCLDRFLKGEE